MEKLLISSCLLGNFCKYDGGHNGLGPEILAALKARYELIPVCPETAGGLPTPRDPGERQGDRVISIRGADITAQYRKGAETAFGLCEKFGCKKALLKAKSPSCGRDLIYDGSFSGTLCPGHGTAAELLLQNKLSVFTEKEWEALL